MSDKPPRKKSRIVYLFLLLPFVAVLWVPFYNRTQPTLFGIPFFYWYQMLWIALAALATLPVYLFEKRGEK